MILRLSDFQFPDAPARLYPDTPDRDWYLEVGFGDGRFWPHLAPTLDFPNYLGVEISGVSLLKAHRRLRDARIENAHVTKLLALPLVQGVIPPESLTGIIVNFPDPWPKAGHEEHRLLRAPFLTLAANRLKLGGAVWFTTDHDEYFEFACAQARDTGLFELDFTAPPASALETKYALKWRELGLGVNHVRFRKIKHPDAPAFDIHPYPAEEAHVPHAILTLPDTLDLNAFEKFTARDPRGAYTVILLEAYRSVRRDEFTFLAHVVEDELTQEVLVNVTRRADGSSLVRLGRFGGPIITTGVKAAVATVTAWLEERGGVVTHRGY
ncbi:tRNA (guanine(46)-N(7))-methyltransferase TrmB [Deinococcus maricopensis]|uniref:tRNA (guanine-N(7)-)-methyltransferase n=1 Tax=Deinococcus maricopensis (strain DSM 21211 / LMG 22137 / NRRL B-23946 / LB-34) TaxID=709986 RepID=E8UBP9_DEIML|nr:tRNA (guanine-N(7)-)-methyltransferase [Deinococcus maricopensis]ADV68488.1 tRNA (guanine-N(7)-)-methyltransferase [Deinococcus maricopensis DSM 21211]